MNATPLVRKLIAEVIDREGDFSDHPADRGGPTRYGITEAVARDHGYTGEMRALPRELAAQIYLKRYWERPGFDHVAELNPTAAAYLFDWGVNSGPAMAIRSLQTFLNVMNQQGRLYADIEVDGGLGPATLGALQAYLKARGRNAWRNLCTDINASRLVFCRRLAESRASQEVFVFGWYNRIIDLIQQVEDSSPVPETWFDEVIVS